MDRNTHKMHKNLNPTEIHNYMVYQSHQNSKSSGKIYLEIREYLQTIKHHIDNSIGFDVDYSINKRVITPHHSVSQYINTTPNRKQ